LSFPWQYGTVHYENNRRRILLHSYPPMARAVHRGKRASQWTIDIPTT
jgi:hypothetical protein